MLWLENRAPVPSPPPRETAALRGALTPACILINIIPPSINSKSTCFTLGEKNNPHLVSHTSPGAAEGLNPPDSLPPLFAWGLLTGCSAACHRDGFGIRRWQHGNVAEWVGASYWSGRGTQYHLCTQGFQSSEHCYATGMSIPILTEGALGFGEVQELLRSHC